VPTKPHEDNDAWKPVIGVMGGACVSDQVLRMARKLGELVANNGWVLLNGGRNVGVMAASAEGARMAGGTVVGILPGDDRRDASPNLTIAITTGMGDGRNLINILSSDVVIACQGDAGTYSEVCLAIKNAKRVILLQWESATLFDSMAAHGRLTHARSPEDAVAQVTTELADQP